MADAPMPLTAEEAGIVGATKAVDRLHARIAELESERDEWKQQHENLLEVRRQDLAALTARTATPSPPVAAPPATPGNMPWNELRPLMLAVMEADAATHGVHTRGTTNWAAAIAKAVVAAQPQPAQPLTGAAPLSDEQADRLIAALCPDFNDEAYPNDRPVMRELARNALTAPSTPTPPGDAPCSA